MSDLLTNLAAAAGAAGGDGTYIEDVFSTYLYTGTGAAQTITNGIDLDGEGGLVWIKARSFAGSNVLIDTQRGVDKLLLSNGTSANSTYATGLTSFNSNGFTLGTDTDGIVNFSTARFASWTFRKAPKFFDVVTYTGTGANRTVAHNLGSVPGCIMVKRTDTTGAWQVYHRANTANPETDYLVLNTTAATADSDTRWNDTLPTDSVFTVGTEATVNASGGTYVAYLFAHDAGGFGDSGSENVITCGSWIASSTAPVNVNLGYEVQWLLVKRAIGGTQSWLLYDVMRGMPVGGSDAYLQPNSSAAESLDANYIEPTATGFTVAQNALGNNGDTYIYIAIRRGPMKTPTSGTEVFTPVAYAGDNSATRLVDTGINIDMHIQAKLSGPDFFVLTRLIGAPYIRTRATSAETSSAGSFGIPTILTSQNNKFGFVSGATDLSNVNATGSNYVDWAFTRAPGFFDVVCYTGTGSARTVAHNLGVVPQLMIIKNRSQADAWAVYAGDNTDYLVLNDTAATADDNTYWNDTSPTSTNFTVGTVHNTNASAENYVAYLFASLAGVSKVGTYTGNGSSVTVTTGFQPRFILVKRTDSTGNWIVGDSARGLVAGDDPALLLNSNAAETTGQDWVDVSSTSFTVNETALNANVSTATYIYLCVA